MKNSSILQTLFGIFLLAFLLPPATAQKRSFGDLETVVMTSTGIIKSGDEVKGYYFLHHRKGDKRGEMEYVLQLVDQNLEPVGKKTFKGNNSLSVTSVAYNGDLLAVRLVDTEEEKSWVQLLDGEGKSVDRTTLSYTIYDHPQYAESMTSQGYFPLAAVPGGFMSYSTTTAKKSAMSKTGYEIRFIPNDPEGKSWKLSSNEDREEFEAAGFLAADENIVLSFVGRRDGLMSRAMYFDVLAVDLQTGKELFTYRASEMENTVWLTDATVSGDRILLGGQYFGPDDKMIKDRPQGLALIELDRSGKEKKESYLSYEQSLGKHFEMDSKGRVEGIGNLMLHGLHITPDGSVVAAMEGFTTFNKLVTIKDALLLYLDPTMKLQTVEHLEKDQRTVELPMKGAALAGPMVLGFAAKSIGAFDFSYMQPNEDVVTVSFLNFERRKGEKNGLSVYTCTLLDGAFTRDKIRLDSDSDRASVFPSKDGYVMVMEYFAKEKRLDARLERLRM